MTKVSSLANFVDIKEFNNLLINGGGDPILTKKKIVSMRNFIRILLKLFKNNYDSIKTRSSRRTSRSSRSGGEGLGNYASATLYSDLNYTNQYQFPTAALTERSFI
jgi:hypothetical protein|uniref:Uncharacterized protein n=1 Tax=viral metagenome TaxID=1070528 RepID=A0A6C0LI79_9ZZZZ